MRTKSAKVPEFGFCSFEDGNIGIRTVPKREELLVLGSSLCGFPRHGIGSSQFEVGERADGRIPHDAAMVDHFLKFGGGLRTFSLG